MKPDRNPGSTVAFTLSMLSVRAAEVSVVTFTNRHYWK
jgi:hypothetical protein